MAESANLRVCWRRLGISPETILRRGLPTFDEPAELAEAEVSSNGRVHQLTATAAEAWGAMKQAAVGASVEMYLISGFRSIERQAELIEAKLKQGQPISDILTLLAPPGCSEHHTGRAVDIGAPGYRGLDEAFENSEVFEWLQSNAQRFGFALSFPRGNRWGYLYEPWHWCYHPGESGRIPPI